MTQTRRHPSYSASLLLFLHLLPILILPIPITHAVPLHPPRSQSPPHPSLFLNATLSRAQANIKNSAKPASTPPQNKSPSAANILPSQEETTTPTKKVQQNLSNTTSPKTNKPASKSSNTTTTTTTTPKTPASRPPSDKHPLPTTQDDQTPHADEAEANMSPTDMLAHARRGDNRFLQGGIVEFIEWLFVFILVAPGTFPAIGCVLLSCASFWRRRVSGNVPSDQDSPREDVHPDFRAIAAMVPGGYQRVSLADNGALVSRTRKNTNDDREADL